MNILDQLNRYCAPALPVLAPLVAFTDGSCIGNGKKNARAGYAVAWPYHPAQHASVTMTTRLHGALTNNRAELFAILEAFAGATVIDPQRSQTLCIYSDSELLVKSMNEWMKAWKARQWRKANNDPVLNVDLLKRLDDCMHQRSWTITHVRAHTNKSNFNATWNAVADKLARDAATKAGPVGCP